MPNINSWLGDVPFAGNWVDDVSRTADTAKLIADKPTSIVVIRQGTPLAAQTVRLEPLLLGNERTGAVESGRNMVTASGDAIVIGYKNHPTFADTDLQRGDRFRIADDQAQYDVVQIEPARDFRLIAYARVVNR